MHGEIHDYPTRILVTSESDGESAYLVDLVAFPVGKEFNGSCTCPHFQFQLKQKLKEPTNKFLYRCKHLRWSRDHALDFLLPYLKKADPNINEEHQT